MVQYRLQAESKNDKFSTDFICFYVFDQELNEIWNNQFMMPYTEEMMDNLDFDVDKDGNAYLLAKVYEEKRKEVVNDLPNYHFELMQFQKDVKQPNVTKIDLGKKFVDDIRLEEYIDGNMLIAGLYTETRPAKYSPFGPTKYSGAGGIFTFQINKKGDIDNDINKFNNFPAEVIKQNELKKNQAKIDKAVKNPKINVEIEGLEWRDMFIEKNGDIIIATEQHIKQYYTNSSGKNSRTIDFFTDIYCAKLNKDGGMEWFTKIAKEQKGLKGKQGMSYKMINHNNNSYFFYIDHRDNLNFEGDDKPSIHTDGAGGDLVVAKIDKDGDVTKEKLFDIRDTGYYLKPPNFKLINSNDIVGSVSKGRLVEKGGPKPSATKMLRISFSD